MSTIEQKYRKKQHYLKKELYHLIKSDESIFDFIQENALDGLWYWDLMHPQHQWMDPKCWKTLGYDSDAMPRDASAWMNFVNPEDLKLATENAQKHDENPAHPYDQIIRYQHKNGSTVWIRCRCIVIRDHEGKAIRLLGAQHEVTKETGDATSGRQDHEIMLSILNKQSVFIIKTDLHGNYTFANDYFCQQLGVRREELIGKSSLEQILPQDHQKYRETVKQCIARQNIPHAVILRNSLPEQGSLTYEYVISAFTKEDKETVELLSVGYNITEKKKNEQALRVAHQRLTSHLNNSPLGIVEYNKALIVTKWSKRCQEIFEWSESEILNNHITAFNLIYKGDLKATGKIAEELLAGKVNGNISYNRNYTKSGKVVHCVWYNSVIKNESGEVISIMSLVQDISQQKHYEQTIIKSQLKLTNVINNLPGFVYRCKNDRHWTMEYISKACKEVLGFASKDFTGDHALPYNELIHPDDRAMVWNDIQEALKRKQQYQLTYRIIAKDKTEKWVWEKGIGIEDNKGNLLALEGFIQDITEKRKAERDILLEKTLSDNIINSLPGVFYLYNTKGQFLRWNKNLETVTGYSGEEISKIHPIDLFDEDEKELLTMKIANVFTAGEDYVEANFLLKNKQKIPYYFTGIAGVYKGETCLMGVGMDISDRVRAEESLKQLLFTTTEQNNRLKDYSYITSHNIRSSVSTLMGLMQLIEQEPENKDYLQLIQVTIEKLDKTIRNINELLNLENSSHLHQKTDCNLSEAIQRVIKLNDHLIKENHIEIRTHIKEGLTHHSIPSVLESIFQHLISNAIKYGTTPSSKTIEISAKEESGKIAIYIQDYGLGLDLKQCETKLFKPGSRFHPSLSDGQGMGLYMTKRQIESMGGSISIESTVNQGTTIKLYLYDETHRIH